MSCYEWESGTIHFSTKEWPKFRKLMITVWNNRQYEIFEVAKKAHVAAKAAAKGKRGANRDKPIMAAIAKACGSSLNQWGSIADTSCQELWDGVLRLILIKEKGKSTNTKNPQKKDLEVFPVSKNCSFDYAGCDVGFRNETRSLVWDVGENNHARDYAHEHWYTRRLFQELFQVTWTRGTGGTIVGNDEYNKDSDYEGGGGNYATHRIGPLGKEMRQAW